MPWMQREQIAPLSAEALVGVRLASVRGGAERAALSDDDKERVRRKLGDDAAESRLVRFVTSTEMRATDGHVIKAAGWRHATYDTNPIVLWQHSRWQQRVADSVVWVDGTVQRAIASFFPRDLSPLSHTLGELAARRGHAASVGFDIISARPASEEVRKAIPWALDIDAAELCEWSLVNLPADAGALADARADGLDVDAVAAAVSELLDVVGVNRAALERVWAAAADPARPRTFVPPPPPPPPPPPTTTPTTPTTPNPEMLPEYAARLALATHGTTIVEAIREASKGFGGQLRRS